MLKKIIIKEKNRNDITRNIHLRKKSLWRANRVGTESESSTPEVNLLNWLHRLEKLLEDPVVVHA
jgi:hypothetical protein